MGTLTGDQLLREGTATIGGIILDLSPDAVNLGLEEWQTAGVDLEVKTEDQNGNVITGDIEYESDDLYRILVTAVPKEEGEETSSGPQAEGQTGGDTASIRVFTPELLYSDSCYFYGEQAPSDFSENRAGVRWLHEGV